MKTALRNTFILLICAPTIAVTYFLSLYRGRKQAIRTVGPFVTAAAKRSLRYWVPEISDASRFDDFRQKMKRNFRRWRPLYDIEIAEDEPDIFKIRVTNCPFCEVFAFVGLKDLNSYFCRADWEIAEDNKGKWIFERGHTIEAGDRFCDHTYRAMPPC